MILAIDPGTKRTGWVLIAGTITDWPYLPLQYGISEPDGMRDIVKGLIPDVQAIVIEKPV
jgi:hypothetical protein